MNQSVKWLNELSATDAERELLKCCGSRRWAERMCGARPFINPRHLYDEANQIWGSLSAEDWLEAFRAHPKIGQKNAATAQSQQSQAWSSHEQSGVTDSSAQTIAELAQLNQAYEDRFGFIFIVCASGKSSDEILEILNARVNNDPETELLIAAKEQGKITRLRLEKLLRDL
jgi:OHCU decarboxylase